MKAEMFGTTYDDNSDAGYAFDTTGCAFPATMEIVNALRGVLSYKAATTDGAVAFSSPTPFVCSMLDWEFVLDTGIEPAWCTTNNVTTWAALKYTAPSCTFAPIMRTSATTYAAIKTAADAGTYQGLTFLIEGTTTARSLKILMTGLWDVVPTVHDDQDGEVVIKPTFRCQTAHTQTTSPHWLTIENESTHAWT
jgi:hypothetical protein